MSYLSISLVFFALISVVNGQQLMSLSSFKGNNVQNPLNVPVPYSIYVSAHSDAENTLRNVFIVSGAESISLYDLKNRRLDQNFGELERYIIKDSAYLKTLLSDDQLAKLDGVIYLSSPDQVANNNFHVFDVNLDQNLKLDGLGEIDLTILFLNTNMATGPKRSTLISQWSQNPNSLVYIYDGFPTGAIEPKNVQIFSNPMATDMFNQYFPSVETFSISKVAFYMRTYKGAPNFRIEPGYANLAGTYTTAFTTTGFYMKPMGQLDGAVQVNMMEDPKYSGWTGCNIIGYSPNGGMVSFDVYEGSNHYGQSTVVTDFFASWNTPHIGHNFVISSTTPKESVFYVQYFIVQGPLINGTTPLPGSQTTVVTTPKSPESTTKYSEKMNGLTALVLMMALRFL
ncbi:unnamed protein product [Caenorhabditis brenneri]